MWNSTIKRIESFAGLKKLYLFKGGRANFIKSTLSSLLAYYLSFLFRLVLLIDWRKLDLRWNGGKEV